MWWGIGFGALLCFVLFWLIGAVISPRAAPAA